MKVGFIGLGVIGSGISANLQKAGHAMVVHDARRAAADKIVASGAEWAGSPKAVAEASEIVFTSLPGPPEFEAVSTGKDGLISGLQRGQPVFDFSTNSPTLIRRLEPMFAERGAHLFDSPVSGGPGGAASGKMAIWVGGDEAVFQRYRPVLDGAGDQILHIGPIGSASVAKLVHNLAGYVINTALAEAFTMGVKAGVEPLTRSEERRVGKECRSLCDWSSDVCSSDLGLGRQAGPQSRGLRDQHSARRSLHHGREGGRRAAHQIGRASCRERV